MGQSTIGGRWTRNICLPLTVTILEALPLFDLTMNLDHHLFWGCVLLFLLNINYSFVSGMMGLKKQDLRPYLKACQGSELAAKILAESLNNQTNVLWGAT